MMAGTWNTVQELYFYFTFLFIVNLIFTGQTKVWTRPAENSSFRMIRLQTIFNDINADTLYDVLHDPVYRKVNQKTLKS